MRAELRGSASRVKIFLFTTVLCAGLVVSGSFAADELTFGDQWDTFYKQLSNEEPALIPPGWRGLIELPPPPDDVFTRAEVEHIITLKPLRDRYQPQIQAQITDVVQPFVDDLKLNGAQAAALRVFWKKLVPDITRVHMYFKAHFDRARPRKYSGEVMPSIDPPGHPAYPSGHSTDAHTLALLLGDTWPEKKTQLLSIAQQIALNREIAGVHYRSDTAAGFLLAQQIVTLLPRSAEALALIADLQTALRR